MAVNRKWKKSNFVKIPGGAVRKSRKSPALAKWARLALIRKYFFKSWSLRDGLQKF